MGFLLGGSSLRHNLDKTQNVRSYFCENGALGEEGVIRINEYAGPAAILLRSGLGLQEPRGESQWGQGAGGLRCVQGNPLTPRPTVQGPSLRAGEPTAGP